MGVQSEVVNLILNGLVSSFDDLYDYSTDLPNFTATGMPESLWGKASQDITQAVCRQYAKDSILPIGPDAVYSTICDPYLETLGLEKGQGAAVSIGTGGQCPGVTYEVFATVTGKFGPGGTQATAEQRWAQCSTGVKGPITCTITRTPGGGYQKNVVGSNKTHVFATDGASVETALVSYRFVRCDGLPDDCGDPEPVKYEPRPVNPTAPPIGPGDTNITVETPIGPIDFEVTLNPDGTFTVCSGEDCLTIDPGVSGAEALQGNQAAGKPQLGSEQAGAGSGGVGADDEFPEPDDGQEIVGAIVQLTAVPVGVLPLPQSKPENIYAAVIGNARLKFEDESGESFYGTPQRIQHDTHVLVQPVDNLTIIGARVSVQPNTTYSIVPIYRTKATDQP